ncbi:hypothetical protein ACHAPA_012315 [Fusarium lateritium]
MVGRRPHNNGGNRSSRDFPYRPARNLQAELRRVGNEFGGLDRMISEIENMRASPRQTTGGGDASGSGHDGSSAGGTGVVPGFGQASNTGDDRSTGPNPKPSGSGIGNYANAARRGDREQASRGKGSSYGGISKDKHYKGNPQRGNVQQPKPPQQGLTWVTSTREEEFVDEKHNRVAQRLVNSAGGRQTRIANLWETSVRGNIETEEDLLEVWRTGQTMLKGHKSWYVKMVPVENDHFDKVKDSHTKSRVTNSNHRTDGKYAAAPDYVVRDAAQGAENSCPSCGLPSHGLSMCLKARQGSHAGCPICSHRGHTLDDCSAFQEMTLAEKVDAIVTQRGNMPAFSSAKPWHVWLHEYCNSPEFGKSKPIAAFPWTKKFAIDRVDNSKALAAVQKRFDSNPDDFHVLPPDPATCSYKAIWSTYWRSGKLPWPEAIGDLSSQDDEMPLVQDEDEDEDEDEVEVDNANPWECRLPTNMGRISDKALDDLDIGNPVE